MGNVISIICECIQNKDNVYKNVDSSYCHNCKQEFIKNKHTLLCDNCHSDWEIIV